MFFTIPMMKIPVPALNRLEQTVRDFEKLCALMGIKFRFTKILGGADGVYVESGDKRYIFISDRLRGFRRTFTMFHELGHAILHEPRCCETSRFFERPFETQADLFALLALLPKARLGDFIYMQNSRSKFDRVIFKKRMRLFYDYGL